MYRHDYHYTRLEVPAWRDNPFAAATRVLRVFIQGMERVMPLYPGGKGRMRRVVLHMLHAVFEKLHRLRTEDPAACRRLAGSVMCFLEGMVMEENRLEAMRREELSFAQDEYTWNEREHKRNDLGQFTATGGGSGGAGTSYLVAEKDKRKDSAPGQKRELAAGTEKRQPAPNVGKAQSRAPESLGDVTKRVFRNGKRLQEIRNKNKELYGAGLAGLAKEVKTMSEDERQECMAVFWQDVGKDIPHDDRAIWTLIALARGAEYMEAYIEFINELGRLEKERNKAATEDEKEKIKLQIGKHVDAYNEAHSAENVFSPAYISSKKSVISGWTDAMSTPEVTRQVEAIMRGSGTDLDKAKALGQLFIDNAGMPVSTMEWKEGKEKDTWLGYISEDGKTITMNARAFSKLDPKNFDDFIDKIYHESTHGWQKKLVNGELPQPDGIDEDIEKIIYNWKFYLQSNMLLERKGHHYIQFVEADAEHSGELSEDLLKKWRKAGAIP